MRNIGWHGGFLFTAAVPVAETTDAKLRELVFRELRQHFSINIILEDELSVQNISRHQSCHLRGFEQPNEKKTCTSPLCSRICSCMSQESPEHLGRSNPSIKDRRSTKIA